MMDVAKGISHSCIFISIDITLFVFYISFTFLFFYFTDAPVFVLFVLLQWSNTKSETKFIRFKFRSICTVLFSITQKTITWHRGYIIYIHVNCMIFLLCIISKFFWMKLWHHKLESFELRYMSSLRTHDCFATTQDIFICSLDLVGIQTMIY